MQDNPIMSLRSNIFYKSLTHLTVGIAVSSALFLTACNDSDKQLGTEKAAPVDLSIFEGCYTVGNGEPAQIRVSQQDGSWVMQMKEPESAKQVWDAPEPLELIENSEIPNFFSIDPDNVDAVIGRPDKLLVLAHVKAVYANIDPLLDSQYLSYIYRGANTIYRVECDEVSTDIVGDPHANIVIDNVNESR